MLLQTLFFNHDDSWLTRTRYSLKYQVGVDRVIKTPFWTGGRGRYANGFAEGRETG